MSRNSSDMSTPTDLTPTIATSAATPAAATVDGQAVTARSIADQIAADKYVKAAASASTPTKGVQFTKMVPAGPLPTDNGAIIGVCFGGFWG